MANQFDASVPCPDVAAASTIGNSSEASALAAATAAAAAAAAAASREQTLTPLELPASKDVFGAHRQQPDTHESPMIMPGLSLQRRKTWHAVPTLGALSIITVLSIWTVFQNNNATEFLCHLIKLAFQNVTRKSEQ